MTITKESVAPVVAALRHLGSFTAGIVTALVLAGLNHDDAVALANTIASVGNGLAEVVAGVGVVVPMILGWWSARKASPAGIVATAASMSPEVQHAALAKVPDEAKVQIAEGVPGVATVVIKDDANGGLAKLAQSDEHPNVVTETQNEADAKKGTKIPG